ncbi:MAG: divalent cation tolerance protein CutA [Sulfurovum sp.]|nr:MAG: divalent cation tolerance protein CutA [Sulfurovum sp.]
MKKINYCIISTTTDDSDIAQHITKTLLEKHLVACVQSYPVQSQYH